MAWTTRSTSARPISTTSPKDAVNQGTNLSARLNEHARSIRKAVTTLDIDDFERCFLIVQTGFQKSPEDYLINFFNPIWNSETKICIGLGKRGDSSETRVNKRSPWDALDPGREWTDATTDNQKPPATIIEQIAAHLATHRLTPKSTRSSSTSPKTCAN